MIFLLEANLCCFVSFRFCSAGDQHRALCMLCKPSTIELHTHFVMLFNLLDKFGEVPSVPIGARRAPFSACESDQ